jgi:hypothetical protein
MYLAAAALTFNDTATDDPATPNTCNATRYVVCPDGTAGSLHAYWTYLAGGMLYKDWAHIEDPNVSWQAYQAAYANLPTVPSCGNPWSSNPVPCFGEGRGGESSEGSWYRYSLYRSRNALNAIHTAGYDDPILYGPQMSYGTSSWWDLHYIAELNFLTGTFGPSVGGWESTTACSSTCMNYWTTGDSLAYYRIPSDYEELTSTMVFDTYTGRTDRTNALEWPVLNVAFGGPSGLVAELSNDYASALAIDLFLALPAADPTTTSPPSDPRPAFPTDMFNGGNQHILARSGWTSSDTAFSYYCPNTAIDHEHEFCGRFDIFSNGEYITKGRSEFNDYNDLMSAAPQSNLAGYLQPSNSGCPNNNCFLYDAYSGGGQFWHSYQAGEVTLLHNESRAYVAAIVDTTNLYNASAAGGFGYYNGVNAASRSLIYLRGSNQIVYYDRGITASAQDHAMWQVATGPLTINGSTASWPTRSGNQKVYFTSLLSSGGTVADAGAYTGESYPQSSDWEPYTRVVVDAGAQTSTQFLSVLEWGSSSLSQSTTSLVHSSSGTTYDGALIGSSLVMFMRNWPAAITGITYPASQATTQYISDLTPNTTYAITGDGTPANATTDAAGVLTFAATGTGNITIGTATYNLTSITVTPSSASVIALATQQYTATCNYSDGSTANCTSSVTWSSSGGSVITINSSGLATGVAQGSANIIATNGSIQGQAGVTVPAATTSQIALAASANPVTAGQSVSLTASIAEVGNVMPTGTVTFFSNGTSLNSATLSSGAATISTSTLAAGANAITATYTGDSTYPAGASTALSLTVNAASAQATATALAASPNPATTNQAVTLTATVTATSGNPTGSVTFFDGGTSLGSGTISSGVAALQLTSLTAGVHNLTAQYAGNTNFAASASSSVAETVNAPAAATTTTSLAASPNPATTNQAVTLTATVTATSGKPTGSVTFFDGSTSLGSGTIGSGVASVQLSTLSVGVHNLTAQYAGNTSFAASVSSAVAETINAPAATPTATLLQTSASQIVAGQPLTLTATVSASSGTPTGTVTFLSGSTSLGTATLNSSGNASIQVPSLAAGSYGFTAQYAGNSNFGASASASITETVTSAAVPTTTTTLTINPNPTPTGQSVTMSATVTSASGTPTGTVSFLNNGTAIGSATLNNGVATYTASSLPAGTYPITAQYAGTSSFNLSTSSTVQWTVEASGVTLSLNTSTLKVPLGVSASNNVTLTLTPFGGYSGELQMACKSPTAGTTCTFQPQTVNISQNSGPSNVNVTIKTSSNVSSADPHNRQPFASTRSLVLSASFLWFPGILAAAFVGLKRRQLLPRSGRLLLLLVLCCMFGAVTGCGSGAMDPLASPTVTALQLVVSGAGNVNQSITLNVTTTQ